MKKIIVICLISFLYSCDELPHETEESVLENMSEVSHSETPQLKKVNSHFLGSYVGAFNADKTNDSKNPSYSNKINVTIKELSEGKIKGQSIIAGNDRPFFGSYSTDENGLIKVKASEPGDDKHDGKFEFVLDTFNHVVKGKWICNDANAAVRVRVYELAKKDFKYVPEYILNEDIVGAEFYNASSKGESGEKYEAVTSDVLTVNPSTQELTKADIENMYKGDLEVIRNSIYARHGYSFKNRRMRYLFDNFADWYVPISTDVRHDLTRIEKKNVDLLKRFENHAEKYYDEYGR